MKTLRIRQAISAVALLSLLTLAGCATTEDDPTGPGADADAVRVAEVASIDHGVAALPSSDELPAGFELTYRCPGGDFCPSTADYDEASLVAAASVPSGVVEPELWSGSSFSFSIALYSDTVAAQVALENEREVVAEKAGDFDVAPKVIENGFVAGETGSGESTDIEIAGWAGIQGQWTSIITAPEDDPSAERESAQITLAHESAVVTCKSGRYAVEGEGIASAECSQAVEEYLERLAAIDPADAPRVVTVNRLAAAMPAEDDLPASHEVSVRCPGDSACSDARQDQDASVSVDLALPDGVTPQGDGRNRFVVAGGEWSENLWLRAYIKADEAAAKATVTERTSGYGDLLGELNTQPKATDSGYDYGIDGRGEVIEIAGEGWSGQLKVYEARFLHLDGRIGDPRFDIRGSVSGGNVLLNIDSSFTVEGRDQADAVDTVKKQIAGFFERLKVAP